MLQLQKSGGTFVSVVGTLPQIGSLIDCRTWWLLPKWGQKLGYLVGKHTKPVAEMLWRGKQTFPFLSFWWASSQCASTRHCKMARHSKGATCTCIIFAIWAAIGCLCQKRLSAENIFFRFKHWGQHAPAGALIRGLIPAPSKPTHLLWGAAIFLGNIILLAHKPLGFIERYIICVPIGQIDEAIIKYMITQLW